MARVPKRKQTDTNTQDERSNKHAKSTPSSASDVYDSDEELGEEPVIDRFSWRLPPEESFSDWKLEVIWKQTDEGGNAVTKTDTYHVHKLALAVGPRRSEYFVRLFSDGGRFAESSTSTSRLELHELQAKHFEKLLEYVYCPGVALNKMTTPSVLVALHSLACYFGMRRLRFETKKLCTERMTLKSCASIYEHAKILNDDKIQKCTAAFVCKRARQIRPESRIVHVSDAEFWLQVLEKSKCICKRHACHFSTLIAEFCRNNDVDASVFKKLSSKDLLPDIDSSAALALIDAERRFVAPDPARKSALQERCLSVMKDKWMCINFESTETMKLAEQQSSTILAELVSHITKDAKEAKRVGRTYPFNS